jgi:hypothetical protein
MEYAILCFCAAIWLALLGILIKLHDILAELRK